MSTIPLLERKKKHVSAKIHVLRKSQGAYADLVYGQSRIALGRLDSLSPTQILDQVVRVALGQIRIDDLDALQALKRANKSARWKDTRWEYGIDAK